MVGSNAFGATNPPKKRSTHAQIYNQTILIDGIIDDSLFNSGNHTINNFTIFEPTSGERSKYETEVKVFYTKKGVYIAAKLYDKEPDKILRELGARDKLVNADYFGVTIDTYQAGLNAYSFIVSAAGIQIDRKITNDLDNPEDSNWNQVWYSGTKITEEGWNVEMLIPYYTMIFPSEGIHDWNIQFVRSVRRDRELSYWNPVDPGNSGKINQMGEIKNISNLHTPLRLSITPYVNAGINANLNPDNFGIYKYNYGGGANIKYGINQNFTLDMTLIPDFSNVISDVQVLNLSPFEIDFTENRPFFTEGTDIFSLSGLFYSRRIGGKPYTDPFALQDKYLVANQITKPRLLNAIKLSGRTNGKTGIGFLNAIEAPKDVLLVSTETDTIEQRINPLTNYSVIVIDQGLKNNSNITLTNTNVIRQGKEAHDANVTALGANLRNNSQTYQLSAQYNLSQRFIDNTVDLGHKYFASFQKISGLHQFEVFTNVESKKYNPNDLGFLRSPNEKTYGGFWHYKQFKPKSKRLVNYRLSTGITYGTLYQPNNFTDFTLLFKGGGKLNTFFGFGGNLAIKPFGTVDYFEPRTSDFSVGLKRPASATVGGFISTDYRKALALDLRGEYQHALQNQKYYKLVIEPRIRLNNHISLFPNVTFIKEVNNIGYIRIDTFEPEAYLPTDIPIASRNINRIINGINANFIINKNVFSSLRLNHYYSSVDYLDYYKLTSNELIPVNYNDIEQDGSKRYDFIYNSFNIDGQVTWRFAPGSDIIVSCRSNLIKTDSESKKYLENLGYISNAFEDFYINFKCLYFLDINRFIRR